MKFKIPFVYHAMAVPPGKRKRYPMSFVDEIEVDVMAVSGSQATVVAEWEHLDRYWDGNARGSMRFYGGTLYAARSAWDDDLCDFVSVTPGELTAPDVLATVDGPGIDGEILESFLSGDGIVPFEKCRAVEDCDRESVEEILRDRLSRMLIVDGRVWEPCDAPLLAIDFAHSTEAAVRADATTFTDGEKCAAFTARLPREWYEKPVVIDRSRPELLEAIRGMVHADDRPYLPVFELDDIPPDLCGRTFERGILEFARVSLEALPAPLQTFDNGTITAWLTLRMAADGLERSLTDEENIDGHIEAVLDAMEGVAVMTHGKCALRLALLNRIWEARDIDHQVARPRPLP